MLKIWSMKQQQQKSEAASGQSKKKKVTAAQLRVQKGECDTTHEMLGVVLYTTVLTMQTRPLRARARQHDENALPQPG